MSLSMYDWVTGHWGWNQLALDLVGPPSDAPLTGFSEWLVYPDSWLGIHPLVVSFYQDLSAPFVVLVVGATIYLFGVAIVNPDEFGTPKPPPVDSL